MYRVTFDENNDGGTLECPRCGTSYEFDLGNDARLVIHSHFNPDPNAHIDACPAVKLMPGETPWEAVGSNGTVIARGRVVIRQIGNAIQSPEVLQDWPAR